MLRETLERASHAGLFGVVGLILMLALFVGVIIWVWRMDRDVIDHMGHLPLDAGDTLPTTQEKKI